MIPVIASECSQFLSECNDNYIIKPLPKTYHGFCKVKVRFGNRQNDFTDSFNEAFKDNSRELHKRAIFAYTDNRIVSASDDEDPFYIFPINGYKLLYNPIIQNSEEAYSDIGINNALITELLKLSYTSGNLAEAFSHNCEIIIYNIPYYYAIRSSILDDCGYIL